MTLNQTPAHLRCPNIARTTKHSVKSLHGRILCMRKKLIPLFLTRTKGIEAMTPYLFVKAEGSERSNVNDMTWLQKGIIKLQQDIAICKDFIRTQSWLELSVESPLLEEIQWTIIDRYVKMLSINQFNDSTDPNDFLLFFLVAWLSTIIRISPEVNFLELVYKAQP